MARPRGARDVLNRPPPAAPPPPPETEIEHEPDFQGGRATEPGTSGWAEQEAKAGRFDPALVTEEYARANPHSPESYIFYQTHELVNGEWVFKSEETAPWQNFMGTWFGWDPATASPVVLVHNTDGSWTNPATGEIFAADDLIDYRDKSGGGARGGDFDADGNFVGNGQGGFDSEGNPVGGGERGFTSAQNSLLATVKDLLSQFDLDTPGLLDFVTQAISKGWDQPQIMLELRQHDDYLANPLFAANIEATKGGARFRSEGELLAYQTEVRRISRQYGFAEPPSSYIAQGVLTNKSLAEIEHILQVQKQTEIYGPAFRGFVEQRMGRNLSDQDLFEIFDPEIDTQDFDDAFRAASYQARPFILGLGIRSEAEMRAAEMMGIDPEEWFRRFESVKSNLPQFERLAQVESMVTGNLPADFGSFLAGVDNGLLTRGLVFQDPAALAELQRLVSSEVGRFNVGGGAATSQGGQAVGLLTGAERESYG